MKLHHVAVIFVYASFSLQHDNDPELEPTIRRAWTVATELWDGLQEKMDEWLHTFITKPNLLKYYYNYGQFKFGLANFLMLQELEACEKYNFSDETDDFPWVLRVIPHFSHDLVK